MRRKKCSASPCPNLSYDKEFHMCEIETSQLNTFSYEQFPANTLFDAEAKGKSEMAYFTSHASGQIDGWMSLFICFLWR